MQTENKTRTQRRLEKRQTIVILALLLLASLLSFVLGVTTGRRGAERDFAQQVREQQEEVRVVQVPSAPPVAAPAPTPGEEPGGEKGVLIDTVVETARSSAVILGIEPPDRFPLVYYRDNYVQIKSPRQRWGARESRDLQQLIHNLQHQAIAVPFLLLI